jgi:hypothetical protein
MSNHDEATHYLNLMTNNLLLLRAVPAEAWAEVSVENLKYISSDLSYLLDLSEKNRKNPNYEILPSHSSLRLSHHHDGRARW